MQEVFTKTNNQELDLPEIIIFGILFIIIIQKFIIPYLIQLKIDTIALLHNGIFYLIVFIFLSISFIIIFQFIKKRKERLAREEKERKIFREKMEAEEKKEKAFYAHLERKPRELPIYVNQIIEEPKERVNINVDLDKGFYKRNSINKHEIKYLIEQGYKELSYKSICSKKKENYLLKPRFNESLNHMIIIYDISEYLTKRKIKNNIFTTRMPDVVISLGRKEIALEVETGAVMSNMKKFKEKLYLLNKNYGKDWYFIVTNRNLIKKYKAYGKVIDPRYIRGQLDKILKLTVKQACDFCR